MLKRITQIVTANLRPQQFIFARCLPSSTTASSSKDQKWDLCVGVLVERLPIVSKTLNPLERQIQEMLWSVEFENSLKSDHELKHERDIIAAELIKKGKMEVDLEETSSKQTAQDLVDAYTEELKKFQCASRSTADDATNNTTSTNRSLEEILYLLIEEKLGKQTHFMLPQGMRLEGETMRQAAERVLHEKCGEQLQVSFYGNAPCGFYKYKYPAIMREHSVGAKVFFYRAALQQGNVDNTITQKFEWLERQAFDDKLKNVTNYAQSIQKFLL